MKSEDQVRSEIEELQGEIEANNNSIEVAKRFPPCPPATNVIDRCTTSNLAIKCRINALEWVLEGWEEGLTKG